MLSSTLNSNLLICPMEFRRISEVEKRIDDVYSLLQTGLVQQNTPAPRTPEHKGVLQPPIEASPVDSGLGYPVDVSPFPQGFDHSSMYNRIDFFIVGHA